MTGHRIGIFRSFAPATWAEKTTNESALLLVIFGGEAGAKRLQVVRLGKKGIFRSGLGWEGEVAADEVRQEDDPKEDAEAGVG